MPSTIHPPGPSVPQPLDPTGQYAARHDIKPVVASYPSGAEKSPRFNPLVDALPAIKSDEDWLDQLLALPAFEASQRDDEAYLRAYDVAELKDVFIPGDRHLSLARRLDQLIRWGYRKRNPRAPQRAIALQAIYDRAQAEGRPVKMTFSDTQPICSFSLIGVSGMGKSTSVESVLGAYPQLILHPEDNLFQVVWLKVECPKDGSIKELALSILRAFDRVLGTQHAPTTARNITTTQLTGKVNHLAMAYCLGLLVLDELQNLSVKKSGGREEMLNWFQELVNELRLPVVLLGTLKARSLFKGDMRHARRAATTGSATWMPMPLSPEFRLLLKSLWKYQWLRKPGELTEDLVTTIHEETQGVSAFVVDMFLIAQLQALRTRKETLTAEMFRHVARTEFAPVQPVLNALRSNDRNRMLKFEDVLNYDIDELIEAEQLLITRASAVPKTTASDSGSLMARAVANVRSTVGVTEEEARQLVRTVMDGSQRSAQALTKAALAHYFLLTQDSAKSGRDSGDADDAKNT